MSVNLPPLVMAACASALGLTLPMLPWHSMVAVRCQGLLSVVSLGACSTPPLQKIRQAILSSTFGLMTSARIASRGPDSSWDSRRALHRSPPNEFDCHAPSSRGSARPFITMYSTLACPRHTCRHHPCAHNAWCLRRLGPELSSCCLAAASVLGRTTSL